MVRVENIGGISNEVYLLTSTSLTNTVYSWHNKLLITILMYDAQYIDNRSLAGSMHNYSIIYPLRKHSKMIQKASHWSNLPIPGCVLKDHHHNETLYWSNDFPLQGCRIRSVNLSSSDVERFEVNVGCSWFIAKSKCCSISIVFVS